jgi:hypothetical protein
MRRAARGPHAWRRSAQLRPGAMDRKLASFALALALSKITYHSEALRHDNSTRFMHTGQVRAKSLISHPIWVVCSKCAVQDRRTAIT